MHQDGEVTDGVRGHSDLSVDFELVLVGSGVANLHDVEAVHGLVCFLLAEGEERVLVGGSTVGHREVHEATGITFQDLRLAPLNVIQLHLGLDVLLVWRVEAHEEAPLVVGVDVVGHDLAGGELGSAVEHFYRLVLGCRVDVPDRGFADHRQKVGADPAPIDG